MPTSSSTARRPKTEAEKAQLRAYHRERARSIRRVSVTLTEAEYELLLRCAELDGQSPTTHLKRRAFEHMASRYAPPPDIRSKLDELVRVVRGIGNNVNQIARRSNDLKVAVEEYGVLSHLKQATDALIASVVRPPAGGT